MNTLSLHFEHTIENWDEALLLGNGKLENGSISYLKCEATADCDFTIENDLSHLQPDRPLPDKNTIHLNKGEILIFS